MIKKLTILSLFILIGCTDYEEITKNDFINYFETERPKFISDGVLAVQESNNALRYEGKIASDLLIKKVFPSYKKYIQSLEAVKMKTWPVILLHQVFIEAQKIQFKALKKVYAYTKKKKESDINEAQIYFNVSRSLIDWYDQEFKRLLRAFAIPVSMGK